MSLIDQLLEDANQVAEKRNISLSRLSTIVVNDGKFFGKLKDGGSCNVKTFERARAKLRDLEPGLFADSL